MREVFVPISTNKFKKTLGSFATGVTVVTTCLDSKLHGLTVNAFSSLSLNPPLVLICIDKKSESNKFVLLYFLALYITTVFLLTSLIASLYNKIRYRQVSSI